MNPLYNCVLVGLGKIAWHFDIDNKCLRYPLTHYGTYIQHDKTEIIGGFSPDGNDRESFEQSCGGIQTYDNLDDILSLKPHIVSICSPSEFHFEHVMACLRHDIPMVWLEKPPTMTLPELDEILSFINKSGVKTKVLINYMRRYWSVYSRLKEIFCSELLGKPIELNMIYSRGLELNGSHFIDLAFSLFDDKVSFELIRPEKETDMKNPSFCLVFDTEFRTRFTGIDATYHIGDTILTCEGGRASILSGGLETRVEVKSENEFFKGFYRLKQGETDLLGVGGLGDCFLATLDDLIHSFETNTEPKSNLVTARNTQLVIEKARNRWKQR